jgi:Family of unknown function (DUF5996)
MKLSSLVGWEATRDGLHRASQVLGAARVAGVSALPNDLQYSLEVIGEGVSTGALDNGVELRLDYGDGLVRVLDGQRSLATVSLAGQSQVSLLDVLLEQLTAAGKPLEPSRKKILHEEPLVVDRAVAGRYAGVQHRLADALRSFREGLSGARTPVVLWPHHFDVAFLRFTTDGTDEHKHPQLGTGFAPQSEGFPDPYLYVYAWPMPDGLDAVEPLPKPARWVTEGFTGAVVDYADLAKVDDPERLVSEVLGAIHRLIGPRMEEAK